MSSPRNDPARRASRDLLELSVGYLLILAVLWTPRPWQRYLYCVAVLWVLAASIVSFDGWQAMGLRTANFLRSFWVVAAAVALAAVAVGVAYRLHTLHPYPGAMAFVRTYWGYALWAMAQQFLLQDFFLLRLLRLLPGRNWAAIAAAGMFALAHLPNPILTGVTVVWGTAACFLFLRYRNVYTLGLAHAVFGICIAISFPGPVIRNMRVGLGYLTYKSHRSHSAQPIRP